MKRNFPFFAVLLCLIMIAGGCSRTKNTWLNRNYHRVTSKFNPLFNGNEAYDKGVLSIESRHQDDFTQLLPIYIWPDEAGAQAIATDMERAEEKGVKTIREHSMVIGRQQLNHFIDDSYMLIGKSRFYRQLYFPALEAFNYVIVEFPKDDLVPEARLWAGRTYVQLKNYKSAQEQFDFLYQSKQHNKKFQRRVIASMAENEIMAGNYEQAYEYLNEARKLKPVKKKKVRYAYIQAQLLEKLDKEFEASEMYRKVVKMKPEYDFYFQAMLARARSFDPYLQDSGPVYAELRKMMRSDKNRDNLDQIYFVMAEIAIKEEHFPEAFDYLQNSIEKSTTNNIQKGLAYLRKGELHFDFREYIAAEANYDSASTTLPNDHPRYEEVIKKKKSLTELVEHLRMITLQDSLIALAEMPEEERLKKIDKIIEELKKEDERKRDEEERNMLMLAGGEGGGGGGVGGRSGKWYFYDDNMRNTGFSDFTNKWGSRKLEDNWRRKNKERKSDFVPGEDAEGGEQDSLNDKYHPAYYISRIPTDPDSLEVAHDKIVLAHQGAGSIYKDVLEDFPEAIDMYESLLKRYPGAPFEARTLYTLCLMTQETKQVNKSDKYCGDLREQYAGSVFTQLLDGEIDPEMDGKHDSVGEAFYVDVFDAYRQGRYKYAIEKSEKGIAEYGDTDLRPKFEFLRALSHGGMGDKEKLVEQLQLLSEEYEGTIVAIEAQEILDFYSGGTRLEPNSKAEELFSNERNEPFQYVLVVPAKGVKFNSIRNAISNFNQKEFPQESLQTKNILMGTTHQLVIVKGFKRAVGAQEYFEKISKSGDVMRLFPPENFKHFIISQSNFKIFYENQAIDEYQDFFNVKFAAN